MILRTRDQKVTERDKIAAARHFLIHMFSTITGQLKREGKEELTLGAFQNICKNAMTFADPGDRLDLVFHHAYTVLCWSLVSRSISVGKMTFTCLYWDTDCLVYDRHTHNVTYIITVGHMGNIPK